MELIFAEVDVAVGGGVGGQQREDHFLVLITGDRAHQKNVGLVVAVLREIDPFGLLFHLVGPALLRRKGEAIGQHHHRTDLKAHVAAIGTDLLQTLLVGDLDAGGEHRVGEYRLGNFGLGQLLGQVAVGTDDLAGGFPWAVVILLSPEGVGPAGGGGDQQAQAEHQGSDQKGKVATHGNGEGRREREGEGIRPTRAYRPCGNRFQSTGSQRRCRSRRSRWPEQGRGVRGREPPCRWRRTDCRGKGT